MGKKQQKIQEWILSRPTFKNLSVESARDLNGGKYDTIELKRDGIWGQLHFRYSYRGVYSVDIYSRHGVLKSTRNWHSDMGGLEGTVLHGEFIFSSSRGHTKGIDQNFYVFDITRLGKKCTKNMPQQQRISIVRQIVSRGIFEDECWLQQIESYQDFDEAWAKVQTEDYEGLVFKCSKSAFGKNWGRLKREFDVDYVCVGFNQSNAKKYKGRMVKSVKAGLYIGGFLTKVCNVSGMNEAQRVEMFNDPDKFVGKVMKVKCKGIFDSGGARHPNFAGWHSSKDKTECTLEATLSARTTVQ